MGISQQESAGVAGSSTSLRGGAFLSRTGARPPDSSQRSDYSTVMTIPVDALPESTTVRIFLPSLNANEVQFNRIKRTPADIDRCCSAKLLDVDDDAGLAVVPIHGKREGNRLAGVDPSRHDRVDSHQRRNEAVGLRKIGDRGRQVVDQDVGRTK